VAVLGQLVDHGQVPGVQRVGPPQRLLDRPPEECGSLAAEQHEADRLRADDLGGQPLADSPEPPVGVEAHLHVVGVVRLLAVDREADGPGRRGEQPLEHRRLEEGVAVQEQEIPGHLPPGDPAAHQIVGDAEEGVVEDLGVGGRRAWGQEPLDVLAGEPRDDRRAGDPAASERVELPLEQRALVDGQQALGHGRGQREQAPTLPGAEDHGCRHRPTVS
jgi:hypothetical protein